jgi:hypothetical protein
MPKSMDSATGLVKNSMTPSVLPKLPSACIQVFAASAVAKDLVRPAGMGGLLLAAMLAAMLAATASPLGAHSSV